MADQTNKGKNMIDISENDWYFTFGSGHDPGIGWYVKINGTYESAREEMIRRYGLKWAFQYNNAESAGVGTYNLKEAK